MAKLPTMSGEETGKFSAEIDQTMKENAVRNLFFGHRLGNAVKVSFSMQAQFGSLQTVWTINPHRLLESGTSPAEQARAIPKKHRHLRKELLPLP